RSFGTKSEAIVPEAVFDSPQPIPWTIRTATRINIVVLTASEYKEITRIARPVINTGARPVVSSIFPPKGRTNKAEKVQIPTMIPTQVSFEPISLTYSRSGGSVI